MKDFSAGFPALKSFVYAAVFQCYTSTCEYFDKELF